MRDGLNPRRLTLPCGPAFLLRHISGGSCADYMTR